MNPGTWEEKLSALEARLRACGPKVVACSGGVDSMLLGFLAHRASPRDTLIAHGGSAAVPGDAAARISGFAAAHSWNFRRIRTGESSDESYLSNPANRCYFCKRHLYAALSEFRFNPETAAFHTEKSGVGCVILSGTNTDDLGEYRPGLSAAAEFGVKHPFVECGVSKTDIRSIARAFALEFSEIPASPCLASRLYTGTRVTERRLALVDRVESEIRTRADIKVVRGRLRGDAMLIEVPDECRAALTADVLNMVRDLVLREYSDLVQQVEVDPRPYRAGRSFVIAA